MSNGVELRRSGGVATALMAAVLGLGSAAAASAQPFPITNVADSTGPLGTVGFIDHALGNNGHVAFVNSRDDGRYGLYRWSGSTGLQTVAETSATVPGWSSLFAGVGVNDSGQVSFLGFRTTPTASFGGIYRAETTGSVTPINEAAGNDTTAKYEIGSDVNAAGVVAFQRGVDTVSRSVYTGNGVAQQTVFTGAWADSLGWWSVNAAGHTAVGGTIGGVTGVWRGTGDGSLTPLATGLTQVRTPVLHDDGAVTFAGTLGDGTLGVFRAGGGGPLATIASNAAGSLFAGGFGRSSANGDGDVAFIATPAAGGGAGIYFLPDGAAAANAQEVIGIGDPLFGSTVQSVLINPRGLNDADQLAFVYRLANGTWGVALAAVPEPACGVAASVLALAAIARRRRA